MAVKIKRGQKWQPKRGLLWARIIEVLSDERVRVEKYDPASGAPARNVDLKTPSLRRDYTLAEEE